MTGPIRFWKVLTAALGGLVLIIGIWFWRVFFGPIHLEGDVPAPFTVWKGQTFASVVDSLEARGFVRNRTWFVFVARIAGGERMVKAGRYLLTPGTSYLELFRSLRDGVGNLPIAVTIPEGLSIAEQAKMYARLLGIDSTRFVEHAGSPEFARSVGIDANSLEGYLLPDTYRFTWQMNEADIVRAMVTQLKVFFTDSLVRRASVLGMSRHQVLTLASIVEGEAILDNERKTIASVYHNRLRKGMRLEADPTIQYIIPERPRRVTYADLRMDHPYNTYRNVGLPPGPINSPGRASIIATLFPDDTPYLFFVANGRGGHWFSARYEEHMKYVRMYRRWRARQ